MPRYVTGADEFRRFARDLKKMGNGGLYREMVKSLRTNAKPLVDEIKKSVLRVESAGVSGGASARAERALYLLRRRRRINDRTRLLAHRQSGLRRAASRTVQFQIRTAGRSAGIRIKSNSALMPAGQQKLPGHMNTGHWRHPVFGNKETWVTQTVSPPNWFDTPARIKGPQTRDQVIGTLKEYIVKGFGG